MKTLNEKIEELEDKIKDLEKEFEEKANDLNDQIYHLEQMKCPNCEGLGSFRYKEYFDMCRDCGGTGFEVDQSDKIYDEWKDNQ